MNNNTWRALLALGAIAGISVVVGAALVDEDGLFGQLPAAWLQAVGSIAAILGAIWIAGQQARHDATRRAADEADYEYQRMTEALEGVTMLIQIGTQARETARVVADQLNSRSNLKSDFLRVYVPVFKDMLDNLDSTLSILSHKSGIRLLVFNFRVSISHIAFTLRGAVAGLDLGHSPGAEDYAAIRRGLGDGMKMLDGNLQMAKVMQEVWLEAKKEEEARRRRMSGEATRPSAEFIRAGVRYSAMAGAVVTLLGAALCFVVGFFGLTSGRFGDSQVIALVLVGAAFLVGAAVQLAVTRYAKRFRSAPPESNS